MKDFKAFILRGNVVDLAVGIVIGAAFTAVVTAFVTGLLTPLMSIPGKTNFKNLSVTVGHGTFAYGVFLNAVIAFSPRGVGGVLRRGPTGQRPDGAPSCR